MAAEGDEDYLTTAQVARRLRVKPETVYAYVSRGLLTSVRARGRRGSLFAVADVERVASRSVEHSGVVEEIESALTLQSGDELYYRGRSVPDLATRSTLESVAHLLWTGELTEQPPFPVDRPSVDLARAAIAVLPPTARLTDQLRIAVAALGAADPLRFDLHPTAITTAARTLLGTLITALPGPTTSADTSPGTRLYPKLLATTANSMRSTSRGLQQELAGLNKVLPVQAPDSLGSDPIASASASSARDSGSEDGSSASAAAALDAALVLLADHGLAVSTVAARVAASARANLYAVVSAGLGALDGQYHGTAPTLAYDFLARAKHDPLGALSDHLRTGTGVPGFGHKIYRARDPRAEALFTLLGDDPIMQVVDTITAHTKSFPNSDLALAAICHAHNLRPDAGEALFALARIVGWTAHALEEYAAPALRYRAPGVYTGTPTPD